MWATKVPDAVSQWCSGLGCESVQLGRNKFEGCIPDAVASWKVSQEVSISENLLSGVIPGFMNMDVS